MNGSCGRADARMNPKQILLRATSLGSRSKMRSGGTRPGYLLINSMSMRSTEPRFFNVRVGWKAQAEFVLPELLTASVYKDRQALCPMQKARLGVWKMTVSGILETPASNTAHKQQKTLSLMLCLAALARKACRADSLDAKEGS